MNFSFQYQVKQRNIEKLRETLLFLVLCFKSAVEVNWTRKVQKAQKTLNLVQQSGSANIGWFALETFAKVGNLKEVQVKLTDLQNSLTKGWFDRLDTYNYRSDRKLQLVIQLKLTKAYQNLFIPGPCPVPLGFE